MRIRHLRQHDYRRMRWNNGGGWTTELAASTSAARDGAFDWRISIADIDSDGAFSTFAQCDRFIALLEGNGMRLHFDAAPSALLDRRFAFVPFCGDWHTHGSLIDGPVRDFNVIARRDRFEVDVSHRSLTGAIRLAAEPDVTWFVYLAAGHATIPDIAAPIAAGESLWIDADARRESIALHGNGECVLVKLKPRVQRRE